MFKNNFFRLARLKNAPTRCLPLLKRGPKTFRHASVFKTRVSTRACPFLKRFRPSKLGTVHKNDHVVTNGSPDLPFGLKGLQIYLHARQPTYLGVVLPHLLGEIFGITITQGPFPTKNATAHNSVVFYYCHSFLLSVTICYLISLLKKWFQSVRRSVLISP